MRNTKKNISKHKSNTELTLKRDLNLFNATAVGVGIIVGAGIYVLLGVAAGLAGNMIWLAFLISAIIAIFTGLSYAELSSMFQKSDGEYSYVSNAMGHNVGLFTGYLVVLAGIISAAAVALGFAGYFGPLIGYTNFIIIASLVIVLFSIINYVGIKQSAQLNVVFTVLEVGALLLIIFLSFKYLGSVDYFEFPNLTGIFSAAVLVFFAYQGFESVVKLSEETKNPSKTIPKALLLSIVITTIIYILVGISAVSVVGWETLAESSEPLALVMQTLIGSKTAILLSIVALFSTGNTVLILLVSTSRMMYGLGKDVSYMKILSNVSAKRRTPLNAIILTAILSILFIFLGKHIEVVANLANFIIFLTFLLVNLSLIILRYKAPRLKREFRTPCNIGRFPIPSFLGVLFCLGMMGYMVVDYLRVLG